MHSVTRRVAQGRRRTVAAACLVWELRRLRLPPPRLERHDSLTDILRPTLSAIDTLHPHVPSTDDRIARLAIVPARRSSPIRSQGCRPPSFTCNGVSLVYLPSQRAGGDVGAKNVATRQAGERASERDGRGRSEGTGRATRTESCRILGHSDNGMQALQRVYRVRRPQRTQADGARVVAELLPARRRSGSC